MRKSPLTVLASALCATALTFEVETSGTHLWSTLTKHEYGNRAIQAATELIDNSISAILMGSGGKGRIRFHFNESTGSASIEDTGPGFPIDPEELKRCWSYGFAKPWGLNEHGCGAKTALSIFDVKGDGWRVYWRNATSPTIYRINGPLQKTMTVTEVPTWPGALSGPSGVYMTFPCATECFRSLYGPNTKTMKIDEAIRRFKREIAQIYYYSPEIASGSIQLEVNGEVVPPFTIDFGARSIRSTIKEEIALGGNNKADVVCFHLSEEIKDSWFKVNSTSMGIYFWKNGRFISLINSGDTFESITGRRAHPSMGGKIMLVNLTGDQSFLPATDPNKTTWRVNSDAFQDLARKLSTVAAPFFGGDKNENYERDHVKQYIDIKRTMIGSLIPGYLCTPNKRINSETPPIDIVEEFPEQKKVHIYEGKRTNQASIDAIGQLHTNFILARKAYEPSGWEIQKAILLLDCTSNHVPIDSNLAAQARILMSESKFPLEIHSYAHGLLWPPPAQTAPAEKVKRSKASGTA